MAMAMGIIKAVAAASEIKKELEGFSICEKDSHMKVVASMKLIRTYCLFDPETFNNVKAIRE